MAQLGVMVHLYCTVQSHHVHVNVCTCWSRWYVSWGSKYLLESSLHLHLSNYMFIAQLGVMVHLMYMNMYMLVQVPVGDMHKVHKSGG